MAIRGVVKASDEQQHTTQAAYSGADIALGVSFTFALDERRSIGVQTHVIRDCEPRELDALFDKITVALDRVGAKYQLRELKLLHKQRTKALADMMEDSARTKDGWIKRWTDSNRRGEWKPDGNQAALMENQRKAQAQTRDDLSALELRIAELEKQIGA